MARGEVTGKKPTVTADPAKRKRGPPTADDPDAVEATPYSEPRSSADAGPPRNRGPPLATSGPKYKRRPVVADPNSLAMSIREFCRLHGISEDQFYKMAREKWGPTIMHVGSRTLISHEAAAEWRRAREQAAKEAAENEAA